MSRLWHDGPLVSSDYVCVHAGQTMHLLHVPMNAMEESLDPERFVRIHRSYIVNLRHIRQLWTLPNRQYVLELASGERLPSGRDYGEKVRTLLANPF
jgi:two-component system LytT family response regulator